MKEVRFLREREKRRASNVAFVFRPGADAVRKKSNAMKYMNLATAAAAPASAALAPALVPQAAVAPAHCLTASSAPNATTQAAAAQSAAPAAAAATDPGQSAPLAERALGSITALCHDVVTQLLVRF